jgi:hypothetical protein
MLGSTEPKRGANSSETLSIKYLPPINMRTHPLSPGFGIHRLTTHYVTGIQSTQQDVTLDNAARWDMNIEYACSARQSVDDLRNNADKVRMFRVVVMH